MLRSQKPTHRRVFDQQRYFGPETARNVKRRAVYFLKSVADHMNRRQRGVRKTAPKSRKGQRHDVRDGDGSWSVRVCPSPPRTPIFGARFPHRARRRPRCRTRCGRGHRLRAGDRRRGHHRIGRVLLIGLAVHTVHPRPPWDGALRTEPPVGPNSGSSRTESGEHTGTVTPASSANGHRCHGLRSTDRGHSERGLPRAPFQRAGAHLRPCRLRHRVGVAHGRTGAKRGPDGPRRRFAQSPPVGRPGRRRPRSARVHARGHLTGADGAGSGCAATCAGRSGRCAVVVGRSAVGLGRHSCLRPVGRISDLGGGVVPP